MANFTFVTTFAEKHAFGFDLTRTAEEYLPSNAKLIVYYEGNKMPEDTDKVKWKQYPNYRVQAFKDGGASEKVRAKIPPKLKVNEGAYNTRKSFLHDAIRFSWKVYAMIEHLDKCDTDYLCWVDADVIFNKKLPEGFLESLVDKDCYASYLNRKRWTETGWIMYNTKHPYHKTWWKHIVDMYDGQKLFNLKNWTDSHVFDAVLKISKQDGVKHVPLVRPNSNKDIAWGNSPLKEYSKHRKGREVSNK